MITIRRPAARIIVAGVVLALLAWSATAFAASSQYNGPAGSTKGAGVEFGVAKLRGRPTRVRRFEFHNIPAQCKGSLGTAATDMLTITMKISAQRRFQGTEKLNGGRLAVSVSGTFAAGFRKASGTIRVRGTVPGCLVADTGVVQWKAPLV